MEKVIKAVKEILDNPGKGEITITKNSEGITINKSIVQKIPNEKE